MTKSSVATGIVTFNPDIERLNENLQAIVPQVDHVFVYDNGSADEKAITELLSSLGCTFDIHFAKDNDGMAKALNGLAAAAREKGFEYLVQLDQDSVATHTMVETLLAFAADDVALVSPRIRDRGESEVQYDRPGVFPVRRVITSGALLNLAIHEEVGGYDERLFVDLVDNEFCYCVRSHGYTVLRCNDADLLHELGKKEHAFAYPKWFKGEGFKLQHLYRSNHALWRRKDIGRSAAIILDTYKGNPLHRRIVLSLGRYSVHALLCERQKTAIIRESIRGFEEGRRIAKQTSRSVAPGASENIML